MVELTEKKSIHIWGDAVGGGGGVEGVGGLICRLICGGKYTCD